MKKLIFGDCSLELKKLPDRCVDLVCTDPPYIVAAHGRGLARSCKYLKEISARGMEDGFDLLLLNEFLGSSELRTSFCFAAGGNCEII